MASPHDEQWKHCTTRGEARFQCEGSRAFFLSAFHAGQSHTSAVATGLDSSSPQPLRTAVQAALAREGSLPGFRFSPDPSRQSAIPPTNPLMFETTVALLGSRLTSTFRELPPPR